MNNDCRLVLISIPARLNTKNTKGAVDEHRRKQKQNTNLLESSSELYFRLREGGGGGNSREEISEHFPPASHARLIKATSLWITDTEPHSTSLFSEVSSHCCHPRKDRITPAILRAPGAFKGLLSDDDSRIYRRQGAYERTKLLTTSVLENLLAGGTV